MREAPQWKHTGKASVTPFSGILWQRIQKMSSWLFLRYCLVGGLNTLVDIATLNMLVWCFPTTNVQMLLVYNTFAYTSGAVSSFFLNKYWTFKHRNRITWREARRFTLTLLAEIFYSNVLLWLAGKALQPFMTNVTLWSNASKLIAVSGGAVISYTLMRLWTFAKKSPDKTKTYPIEGSEQAVKYLTLWFSRIWRAQP